MGKGHVHFVHAVLEALQIVAGNLLGVPDLDQALGHAVREMRERRRLAWAKIAENQPKIFAGRIGPNRDLARETWFLGGLLDAAAGALEFPAVIGATDAVTLDPAEMHRRAAVRAMMSDNLCSSGEAPIKRVILAHDPDRFGVPGRQVLAAIDGMPKLPHECAARSPGACCGYIEFRGLWPRNQCKRWRRLFDQRHGTVLPRPVVTNGMIATLRPAGLSMPCGVSPGAIDAQHRQADRQPR